MAIIIITATRATDIITDIQSAMRSTEIDTREGTNRNYNVETTVSTEKCLFISHHITVVKKEVFRSSCKCCTFQIESDYIR